MEWKQLVWSLEMFPQIKENYTKSLSLESKACHRKHWKHCFITGTDENIKLYSIWLKCLTSWKEQERGVMKGPVFCNGKKQISLI